MTTLRHTRLKYIQYDVAFFEEELPFDKGLPFVVRIYRDMEKDVSCIFLELKHALFPPITDS